MLTSILGNANKSCTMSVLPFSTAINNGVLFKKIFLFEISLKIQLKLNHHSKKSAFGIPLEKLIKLKTTLIKQFKLCNKKKF